MQYTPPFGHFLDTFDLHVVINRILICVQYSTFGIPIVLFIQDYDLISHANVNEVLLADQLINAMDIVDFHGLLCPISFKIENVHLIAQCNLYKRIVILIFSFKAF